MDNSKKIELTAEGRAKLVEELAYREGEKHDEIVERIKEARGFGDLSENSEYDAAKEEEARNAARVNEIRQILSIATVVEAGSSHDLTVSIGTTVELEDEHGRSPRSPSWAPPRPTRSSTRSPTSPPVGAALVGHREGDEIEVVAPSGKTRKYTVTAISPLATRFLRE